MMMDCQTQRKIHTFLKSKGGVVRTAFPRSFLTMTIKGHTYLEQWLAGQFPRAFFYRLPRNFRARVVIYDASAELRRAYSAQTSRTADDFVSRFASRIYETFDAVAASDYTSPDSREIARLTIEERLEMGQDHQFHTDPADEDYPTIPHKAIERREWLQHNDFGQYQMAASPTICLLKDDGRYVPHNRSMLHESRYVNRDLPPLTREELLKFNIRISGSNPLPKNTEDNPLAAGITKRLRNTPIVSRFWQTYGPQALAERLSNQEVLPRDSLPQDVTILLDGVPKSMNLPPEFEASGCLATLPQDWKAGDPQVHTFTVHAGNRVCTPTGISEPEPIGETDIKVLRYIEKAPDNSDVLVCINDSDVFWILLQNAWRWMYPNSDCWRLRVFLDISAGSPSGTNTKRLYHRYVCMNTLAEAVGTHGRYIWKGLTLPHQTLGLLALMTGSDYTNSFFRKGPSDMMRVLNRGGWEILRHAVQRYVDPEFPEFLFLEVDPDAVGNFVLQLFAQSLRKKIKDSRSMSRPVHRMSWHELREHSQSLEKDPRLHLPPFHEVKAYAQRLSYTLNMMNNGGLALGKFFNCYHHEPEADGKSVWGWTLCREGETTGSGSFRFSKVDVDAENTRRRHGQKRKRECDEHARYEDNLRQKFQRIGREIGERLVCAKTPSVSPPEYGTLYLVAEARSRRKNPQLRYRYGHWREHRRCPHYQPPVPGKPSKEDQDEISRILGM